MIGAGTYGGAGYGSMGYNRLIYETDTAQVDVQGQGYDLLLYFDPATAQVNTVGQGAQIVPVFRVGSATVNAASQGAAIEVSGAAFFDTASAGVQVIGHPFTLKLYFDTATARVLSQGQGFDILLYFDTATAQVQAVAYPPGIVATGSADFAAGKAEVNVFSAGVNIVYPAIPDIPDLFVTRNAVGDIIEVDVGNPINAKIEVQRSDEFLEQFAVVESRDVSGLPWDDTGKDINGNYRYVATYFTEGVQDGIPVKIKGDLSNLRITFGKNRTL